jgi:hypothetical protein
MPHPSDRSVRMCSTHALVHTGSTCSALACPITATISVHLPTTPCVPRCARITFYLSLRTNTLSRLPLSLVSRVYSTGIPDWWMVRLYVTRTAFLAYSLVAMLEYDRQGILDIEAGSVLEACFGAYCNQRNHIPCCLNFCGAKTCAAMLVQVRLLMFVFCHLFSPSRPHASLHM